MTDLLPAGFEIENATLGDPTIDGLTLDFEQGMKPSYTASMDDRFIAHFDNRWKQGSFAYVDIASERLTKPMPLFQTLWWKKCMPLKSMDAQVWQRAKCHRNESVKTHITPEPLSWLRR